MSIRFPDDLHVAVKVKMAKTQTTIQDYVLGLIVNDMKNDPEYIAIQKSQDDYGKMWENVGITFEKK